MKPAADEDDPRAVVVVRPRVEVLRRVDDVLDAVQERAARRRRRSAAPSRAARRRRGSGAASSARSRTRSSRAARRGRGSTARTPPSCSWPSSRRDEVARVPLRRRPKSTSGSTSPNDASSDLGRRVEPPELARRRSPASARSVFVTTSVSAAATCLTDSGAAQPVDRVHGRDHALELEVVLDDRLGEQRVDDRRRVGEAGRLDDHAPERAGSRRARAGRAGRAARRRGRRAACSRRSRSSSSTVRSSTRRSRWWSIATSPSSLTITAVSPMSGWASRRESSVVFPLPRKPVTQRDRRLQTRARPAEPGRAGRAARPASRSASTQSAPRFVDDGRAPLAVAEDVDAAAPVVEPQPEVVEHAVQQRDRGSARPRRPPSCSAQCSSSRTPQSAHMS